ncbi:MAG TPA: VOC family protein [Blastocatellia bacterium]|nr:VOC family protein [Blastocatellia bacterium]
MAETSVSQQPAMPAHGNFCWTEIAGTDVEKCKSFYSNVFGWTFEKSPNTGDEMDYFEFSSSGGTEKDGAIYEMKPEMFGGHIPPAHIALYVSVDDIDHSVAQAANLGGSIIFGPYDIPKVGRMAVIQDPSGAAISLITLTPEV